MDWERDKWIGQGLVGAPPNWGEILFKSIWSKSIKEVLNQQSSFLHALNPEYFEPNIYRVVKTCQTGLWARPHTFSKVEVIQGGLCWNCHGEGLNSGDEYSELWEDCPTCRSLGYLPTRYTAKCDRCGKSITKG